MTARALITGISGQDGIYLTEVLSRSGYIVAGTTRDERACLNKFSTFGFKFPSKIFEGEINNEIFLTQVLRDFHPDLIFHLSGQSSVRVSLQNPDTTWLSIAESTEKLLYHVSHIVPMARIVHAASSECFGPRSDIASSSDELRPTNPYSEAKAYAVATARQYRRIHGLYVANAFLFPHESYMRDPRFLVGRIIEAARAFHIHGITPDLNYIADLSGQRDIGLAGEHMQGLRLMAELDRAVDCVIGTGITQSLQLQMKALVTNLGLDLAPKLNEPNELESFESCPSNCSASVLEMTKVISWHPNTSGSDVMFAIGRDYLRWLKSYRT